MSLRDVRKLLDDKSPGEKAFDALDTLLGAVIALSPIGLGPAALPLWTLLEPKNELVKGLREITRQFTKSRPRDYLDQARNMAAANCLLTYSAFFDALGQRLPGLVRELELSAEDKNLIAAGAARKMGEEDLSSTLIAVPHAADRAPSSEEWQLRVGLYLKMSAALELWLSRLDAWNALSEDQQSAVQALLTSDIPSLANEMYEAEYIGLAADFPRFFVWNVLTGQERTDALIATAGADVKTQFELVGLALRGVDLGLERLSRAIAAQPAGTVLPPRDPDLGARAADLHRMYADDLEQPVIEDRYAEAGPALAYPTRAESFVPQAYRVTRYTGTDQHLEREDSWSIHPVEQDLGPFLLRHLESPYGVQTPLLILGHPGSGKSLLTQVLAARLAYPAYTTVRVELRDVNPDADIQAQIEAQIRKDTGRDVNWAEFASNLAMSPPVVILDGYDELLQATGNLFADYLEQARRFQHREAVQGRPVRVIVTSRITLIDKAVVPRDSTIVCLESFDASRRAAWTAVWNASNEAYFRQAEVAPFSLPHNEPVTRLAEQPLLLLMLALYDSRANELSSRPDLDQTLLYHALLIRFIDRELSKGKSGIEFRRLPEPDRQAVLDRELERLGVAAIGMFNRQVLHISRDQLNADLSYFSFSGDAPADRAAGGRRLSAADLLLGSFFFIHESRSGLDEAGGPAAFEFLHNTFGEFLAADFILRRVLAETNAIRAAAADPSLGDMLRQRLASVSPAWFACLVFTPLHTRPNVLALLREWGAHRMMEQSRPGGELLRALDDVVTTQLSAVLTGGTLPDLSAKRQDGTDAPYDQLPALGHLAIYSLNLILLSCYLARERDPYVVDEADLGGQPAGTRAWDRLTSLWRSWFSAESLAALASLMTATRSDSLISVEPEGSRLLIVNESSLHVAYNVGVALADNLTAGTAGLHLASIVGLAGNRVAELRDRIDPDVPFLGEAADSILSRTSYGRPADLPFFSDRYLAEPVAGISADVPRVPLLADFTDVLDRLAVTPRLAARLPDVSPSDLRTFAGLSRYEAELAVRYRVGREPRWLPALVKAEPDPWPGQTAQEWPELLRGPAAAPVLRAAWRHLDQKQCRRVAEQAIHAISGLPVGLFDVETAVAVVVLACRGGGTDLCDPFLDIMIGMCERGSWDVLDVPTDLWGGLADLFVSEGRFAAERARFTALAETAVRAVWPGEGDDFGQWATLAEFAIQALRIGVWRHHEAVRTKLLRSVLQVIYTGRDPKLLFALLRCARENDDVVMIMDAFGGMRADVLAERGGRATAEAEDLRWALGILQQP